MAEAATDLKSLVTPIFLGVSNYWQLAKLGQEIPMDKFRSDMETRLERAKEASRSTTDLARAFDRVLHPLIFFIDYMVKEGPFAFKNEWRLMARDFNELSGDEKFFEVLEETLRYSDNPEAVMPFYIMLGLGFDGIHHDDPAKIHTYLKTLSEKIKPGFDHRSEYLIRFPVKKRVAVKKQTLFQKYKLLCVTGGIAAVALLVNLTFFFIATSDFRESIYTAAANAMVFSATSSTTNADLPSIPLERPAAAPAPVVAPLPVTQVTPAETAEVPETDALPVPPPLPPPVPVSPPAPAGVPASPSEVFND